MKMRYFVIGLAICIVLFAVWNQYRAKQRGIEQFRKFNEANIDGVIRKVESAYKGVLFEIEGSGETFVFFPRTDKKLNESQIFVYTAKEGDRIVKPAYSDTLRLIKGTKVLKYEFINLLK